MILDFYAPFFVADGVFGCVAMGMSYNLPQQLYLREMFARRCQTQEIVHYTRRVLLLLIWLTTSLLLCEILRCGLTVDQSNMRGWCKIFALEHIVGYIDVLRIGSKTMRLDYTVYVA